MLDDEIVFLGSSNGIAHQTSSPTQRPVTGIALHIEKQGSVEGYAMLFRRACTSVVHIGRRSGFESSDSKRSQDHEQQGNAMFRCAVVSRKHAKIAFSDSGHAYLIDLGSHHGTYVRKPGDKFSKMIKSETPTLLAAGDIVTFGKTVGKGDECVRPTVARIELLHAGQNSATSTPFKPLVVPSTASPSSSSDRSVPKSASGRYGVNKSPSSSSDESYASQSGIYSDIEEIPPPTSSSKPAGRECKSISHSDSGSLGQAFNVLKRLLPPSHPPSTLRRLPSVTEIVERPFAHMSSFFFGPESVPTSPTYSPISPSFSDLNFPPPVGFDASQHDIYEHDSNSNKSRSNSPMDLASPSPVAEVVVSRSLSIPPLPTFSVSAPPSPRHPAPLADSQSPDMDIPLVNSPEGSSASGSGGNSPLTDFMGEGAGAQASVPWEMRNESEAVEVIEPPAGVPALTPLPAAVAPAQLDHIKDTLESLKADVAKLQSHRRKYKARFNSNVHVISEKLGEFDDRLLEVNAEYIMLSNQVDNLVHVDVPDLNAHLESVQERVDEFIEEREEIDREREEGEREEGEREKEAMDVDNEKEEARKTLEALEAAVKEMREFRESTTKQIEEELAAIKALHQAAADRLIQLQGEQDKAKEAPAPASETPVLTSLKRKRDDTDENEDVADSERHDSSESPSENDESAIEIVADVNLSKDKDVVMDFNDVPSANLGLLDVVAAVAAARAPDAPPPRKRAKRFASVVAQTATAVTIGAVVTWSALAFT